MKKDKEVKIIIASILLYIVFGFFTNSYMQEYRYQEWKEIRSSYKNTAAGNEPDIKLTIGTVFWPVYWVSVGTTKLVKYCGETNEDTQ